MKKSLILVFCATALLSACGGGGDDAPAPAPAPTAEVPGSASASIAGMMSYLSSLLVAMADTLEPSDSSKFAPPTDDTIEPSAL